MKRFIPWYVRIAAKLVLSRVPASYSTWRKLNFFSHGAMHRTDYALKVFRHHFARVPATGPQGLTILEIGPGDSLLSAVIAAAHGVTEVKLVDAGPFATEDVDVYRAAASVLRDQGLSTPDLSSANSLAQVLALCNATYGTAGLASMREIPTASVDFIWSHAVLEHIRVAQFDEFVQQMRRVLRPGGRCSHLIDLKDHLGGALNNMRIPRSWWEKDWMAGSGFYTNRLRRSEILRSFHRCEQVDWGGLVLNGCPAGGNHQAKFLHGAAVVEAVAAERRLDRQPALVRDRGARDQGTCDEIADRAARVAVGVRTQVGGDRQLELPAADKHVERRVVSLASRLLVPSE